VGALSPLLTQQLGRPVMNGGRIRRLLAGRRFDVVHFHNLSLVGGPALLDYPRGAVTLYTAHEHWLVCPTHVLWRHGREACTGRECLRCQLTYRRPPQWWRLTGTLERHLHRVDAFIALSEFSRAKHREFGFPREMEVLPPFLPDLPPVTGPSPHERPYFLFAGRLERMKGLDDVLPLFAGAGPADLLIAGEGAYEGALRAKAAGSPRVRFLGHVENGHLARFYHHAVAVIAPTIGFETFGMSLIEAFREGTPVLARRVGPYPDIVTAAGGGELFTTADELRLALGAVVADPARRARLGAAGRAAFARFWSEEAVLPRYLDLVERLRARRRGTTPRELVIA
jgi:glycosyltransferase involved in cell wall biosynthesis